MNYESLFTLVVQFQDNINLKKIPGMIISDLIRFVGQNFPGVKEN